MDRRYIGIDIGAEAVKVVELSRTGDGLRWTGRWLAEHNKRPGETLHALLDAVQPNGAHAAASGRFSRQVRLPRIPLKQAQAAGFRFLNKAPTATVVSIGSHGYSVLELRPSGIDVLRENSRCSQGTGNFLRQLVQRFGLSIEEASTLCEGVDRPAPLSGRCPVILKTDMTHLANKGEDRGRILAGLYDAVCENVQVLIKPGVCPPRVMLAGGVSRSERIRRNFARFLAERGMELLPASDDEAVFLQALGCAVLAVEQGHQIPPAAALFGTQDRADFDTVPALAGSLHRVRRLTAAAAAADGAACHALILGFDIGSTGSKVVALDACAGEPVWEDYTNTNGNPVGAARALMERFVNGPAGRSPVVACGATGSGREIVGSLLATCFGVDRVYVLNEIAAHAEGALHYDRRVDTIFEIGGQDAKYIRLADGRVIDAAMNEACSAGTGSFIEEQGRKFSGIDGVVTLGQEALASPAGVSLGQHCSVFMAEVIDEAVAAGVENRPIIAGLYDSVVQNYLNRVKGSRSVGDVIFCQGMPFAANALAAAVARQTGSEVIVPPNPGTVGALGIALLTRKATEWNAVEPLDPHRFLDAQVTRKDTFVCKSTRGCGGAGNRCRIDRISALVEEKEQRFTWGGSCSLWDRGTGKRKLPDQAPDPFRSREDAVEQIVARVTQSRGRPTVALTDEFQLKDLFPFFAVYLYELGFDLRVCRGADQAALKRGIERANVPFCAPMQQFHGLVTSIAEEGPDFIFLPMIRRAQRVAGELDAKVCPIAQGNPDVLRWDLGEAGAAKIVSPLIDVGPSNLVSPEFVQSCERVADALGITSPELRQAAYRRGVEAQRTFDEQCLVFGEQALAFCREHDIVPVVVLGRTYTIYNKVLNSNVPAIVREQGAMPIPVDCYPVDPAVPIFTDMYWGYGQRNLRAAHQIRRTPGIYSIWCSNYSCGPDSFCLHFFGYIMQGRPFAIIETDGHSGDAGTKTRVEAFLHCVHQDRETTHQAPALNDLRTVQRQDNFAADLRTSGEVVLIHRMAAGAELLAATLDALGVRAECLPMADRESVQIGRRYTSGKECVPMCITLGSLLQRLEREQDSTTRFVFMMPQSSGPCRFGTYNVLHRMVLERLQWKDRVRVWSPIEGQYGEGFPSGLFTQVALALITMDFLQQALYDVRPVETHPGAAEQVYRRYVAELTRRMRTEARREPSLSAALLQVMTGRMFGCAELLRRAGRAFAAVKSDREVPTVALVGEIYVRCDPFANDFIIEKLEKRGLRVVPAPFNEWLEYVDWCGWAEGSSKGFGDRISTAVLHRSQDVLYGAIARALRWRPRTTVKQTLEASAPYMRHDLWGEAVLTIGGPVHEWRHGAIDGVVNVGPLECMPTKLAETQFFHIAEREGLPSITLPFNGDPIDGDILDNFVFQVHGDYRERRGRGTGQAVAAGASGA